MKKLVILGLLIVVLIAGCVQEQPTNTIKEPQTTSKQPSEMALKLSDMEGNWTIAERTERTKNDISPEALDFGWQKGYYIRLYKIAGTLLENTVIENSLSVYPIENISEILNLRTNLNHSYTIEDLSNPNIGDNSAAYRWTLTDNYGNQFRYYEIEFVKLNVYQRLFMSGTITDYELLKDLAKKIEQKIS